MDLSFMNSNKGTGGMSERERILRQELADIEAAKLRTTPVYNNLQHLLRPWVFNPQWRNHTFCGKAPLNKRQRH